MLHVLQLIFISNIQCADLTIITLISQFQCDSALHSVPLDSRDILCQKITGQYN